MKSTSPKFSSPPISSPISPGNSTQCTPAPHKTLRRGGRLHRPALPHFLLHTCLRRGTFCHQRQKVPKERRQNQWFWNPCAVVVRKVSKIFTLANKTTQIRSLLSHCPCVYPPRRAPRLCCPSKQGGPLRLPRGAMWGANRAPPVADEAR